jgi:1-deoxy-D-xylulose-5-phosphate reductoisomerase
LAWDALAAPSGTTAVLNAANEVAVDLFLNRQIRFDQIHQVNLGTLEKVLPAAPQSLEDLLDIDRKARATATAIAAGLANRTA